MTILTIVSMASQRAVFIFWGETFFFFRLTPTLVVSFKVKITWASSRTAFVKGTNEVDMKLAMSEPCL
jgi:hypothetical protein